MIGSILSKRFSILLVAYAGILPCSFSLPHSIAALLSSGTYSFFSPRLRSIRSSAWTQAFMFMLFDDWFAILEPVVQYFALWNEKQSRCHIVIFSCCNCCSNCAAVVVIQCCEKNICPLPDFFFFRLPNSPTLVSQNIIHSVTLHKDNQSDDFIYQGNKRFNPDWLCMKNKLPSTPPLAKPWMNCE